MTRGSGGGGYGSRQHVEKSVKTGTGSASARPAGVAQIGNAWGNQHTRAELTTQASACTTTATSTRRSLATKSHSTSARAAAGLGAHSMANPGRKASTAASIQASPAQTLIVTH